MSDYAVFQDHNRHSCIRVAEGPKWVQFIPMASHEITIDRLTPREFYASYRPLDSYPLKRAAEKFLHRGGLTNVTKQATEHLRRILDGNFVAPETSKTLDTEEEANMATKKEGGAAAKKTPAAAKKAPKGSKPEAAAAPPAAKKRAGKAAEGAAAPAKKAGRPREDNTVYSVKDESSVKRGFLREYVDAAKKLGSFTRDKLVDKFEDKDRAVRYFYYCTGKSIFAAAA